MSKAQTFTLQLAGTWYGGYGLAMCPAHRNTRTPALSLADADDGRLLAYCHAGCDFTAVVKAFEGAGIACDQGISALDPHALTRKRFEARARIERRTQQAQQIWQASVPIVGTLGEAYLRGRGISCALSDSLRFVPSCWHASGQSFPALVARVDGGSDFSVHRTYLAADQSTKATIDPVKAMIGRCAGGAVRLSSGPGPLVVCEGIETGLSLLSGLLDGSAQVWAGLSTSGVKGLHLPYQSGILKIASDGDAAGFEAAHHLAHRAAGLGWQVSLLPAPEGQDWNDVLRIQGGKQ
jgi:hypothetical protein